MKQNRDRKRAFKKTDASDHGVPIGAQKQSEIPTLRISQRDQKFEYILKQSGCVLAPEEHM